MKSRILIIIVLVVFGFLSSSAQTSPCGCPDVKDMLYRIKEVNALINEYQRQAQNYQAREESSGEAPVMFTLAEYRKTMQPAVQAVANNVRAAEADPKPNSAKAQTDNHDCITTVTGGSVCLREAILRHESFHTNICKGINPSILSPLADYRDGMTMIAVAKEEITAYTLEKAYLASELAKLPDKCKPPNWYLSYDVTITGEGSNMQATSGARNGLKWKVYHRYSGKIEFNQPVPQLPFTPEQQLLMSPAQIMAAMKKYPPGSVTKWRHKPIILSMFVPIEVAIKDEITTFDYDPGEGDSFEQTTTTETWEGNSTDGALNEFEFYLNSADKNYNLTIPIKPLAPIISKNPPQVKKIKKIIIDRSKNGYGGKPTHEEIPLTTTMVGFDVFEIPTVTGLLEKLLIHHPANLPLDLVIDNITFDSGLVKPTLPYLKGLPNADKNIKIRIYYRLSKLPES